jgi:hypothetical protein
MTREQAMAALAVLEDGAQGESALADALRRCGGGGACAAFNSSI